MELTLRQKVDEGILVKDNLFAFSQAILQKLVNVQANTDAERARLSVAKSFIITVAQLNSQIVNAINGGSLSLAIVGLKTALENLINANYIFDHPKHKNDIAWVDSICEDIYKRTNDITMIKSKLGNTSLCDRAKEINGEALYKVNYATLCDYAHLMLRQPSLNRPETFSKLSIDAISHALCNWLGVVDSIVSFYGIGDCLEITQAVVEFRDKYESRQ